MDTSCFLFIVLVAIAMVHFSGSLDCSTHRSCDACVASGIDCFWCNDDAYRSLHTNESGIPVQFCGSRDELLMMSCSSEQLVGPASNITRMVMGNNSQVTPAAIELKMRAGDPRTFTINVAPQADFPIDLYILMDLTLTLRDTLDALRGSIGDIVQLLGQLTSDANVGFGSFSDKRAVPFSQVTEATTSNPCGQSYDVVGIPASECDASYDFRHRLNLTNDTAEINLRFQEANLTANNDKPEGLMDALMQVAVCEEKVGWRDSSLSRRLVLVITDDEYHYALDGRLAAIVNRHDEECHLDEDGFYTHDTILDYPSTTQMAESLTAHSIIPIFAVDGSQESLYEDLAAKLRSAFVGVRQARSANLLELFQDRYRELSTTVIPTLSVNRLEGINITVLPDKCGNHGFMIAGSRDICRNISSADNVNYTVMVEVTPEACAAYPSGSVSVDVQFVGFGEVTLNIDLLCTCDCSADVVPSSEECHGNGTLQCSSCQCDEGFYGGDCSCQATGGIIPPLNATTVCKASSSDSLMCSGRGSCVCGGCVCNPVEDAPSIDYKGTHCECDPSQCPTGPSGAICSGHGSCSCNASCSCVEGFIGITCNCPNTLDTCRNPNTNVLCSDNGDCRCGICVCKNYTIRSGTYCELCPRCSQNCLRTSDDVLSYIRGQCEDGDSCDRLIFTNNRSLVLGNSKGELRTCIASLQTCRVTYQIDSLLLGTENNLHILIEMDTDDYRNIQEDSCGSSTPVWPWIVGIVVGIIVVGVVALAAWKCIIYWKDYWEYRKFIDMQTSRRWVPKQNQPNQVTSIHSSVVRKAS